MEHTLEEKALMGIVAREEHETLQGLAKMSGDELALLKFKQKVKQRYQVLEDALQYEQTKGVWLFFSLLLLGFVGGIAATTIPLKAILARAVAFPTLFRFLLGAAVTVACVRLIVASFFYRKANKIFQERRREKDLVDADMALLLKVFQPAEVDDADAELLSATEIAARVKEKMGKQLHRESLERTLKHAFRETKGKKYIVKQADAFCR